MTCSLCICRGRLRKRIAGRRAASLTESSPYNIGRVRLALFPQLAAHTIPQLSATVENSSGWQLGRMETKTWLLWVVLENCWPVLTKVCKPRTTFEQLRGNYGIVRFVVNHMAVMRKYAGLSKRGGTMVSVCEISVRA